MLKRPLHNREYSILVALLRSVREKAGVTQVELAKRLGVDQSVISKVERRERRLDVAELRHVSQALGLTLPKFVARYEAELRRGRAS